METMERITAIKEDKNAEERGPTICMLVQHDIEEMNSTVNIIRLPFDLSSSSSEEQEIISDSDGSIVPNNITIIPFVNRSSMLSGSASIALHSKIYFLSGNFWEWKHVPPSLLPDQPQIYALLCRLQFIYIDDPYHIIHLAAPMNTPKNYFPSVFVARDSIYALNAPSSFFPSVLDWDWHSDFDVPRRSGLFERYFPATDSWEILPDPPFFEKWFDERLLDSATVIDPLVFVGTSSFHAIFNLDTLTWDKTLNPVLPNLFFPYGSLFSKHQHPSLYYHDGPGVRKRLDFYGPHTCFNASSPCIKRISLPSPTPQGVYDSTLLDSITDSQHIMAEAKDLDEHDFFDPQSMYFPQAHLLHVGGHIFCHIITAQIRSDLNYRTISIKFFQELPAPPHHHSDSPTIFRPLASFFYKFKTKFVNLGSFTRCSVIGNVPDSWINSPQKKKKQESKPESANKEMDFIMYDPTTTEQEKCQVEDIENDGRETRDLEKLLAAYKAEISMLKQELKKKEEVLKTYEQKFLKA